MTNFPELQEQARLSQLCLGSIVALGLLFLFSPCVCGYDFTVEGTISYVIPSRNSVPHAEQEDDFVFTVQGCNWHIRKTPRLFRKAGREQVLVGETIVASDGTNFYQTTCVEALVRSQTNSSSPTYNARIGPGSVPFGISDPKLIVLWYALGSGCYFSLMDGEHIAPVQVFPEHAYAGDFRVLAKWELSKSPPFLPESIWIDEKPNYQKTNISSWHFTNYTFSVHSFITNGSLVFPQTAFATSIRMDERLPGTVRTSGFVRIQVSHTSLRSAIDSFSPPLPSPALVSDMRTISSNSPFGLAAVGATDWPDLMVSQKRAAGQAQFRRTLPSVNPERDARSRITRTVLAVIAIAPIVLGIFVLNRKTKT